MFRRPRFRPMRRFINTDGPTLTRHAHELISLGRYKEAAGSFEQLAHGAQARGLPQDAQLFLTAGYCWIQMKQINLAMVDIKQGLNTLLSRNKHFRFQKACQQSIIELTNSGFQQEAEEVLQLLRSSLELKSVVKKDDIPVDRRNIPVVCPSCGGTLHSDEVDWIDEFAIECPWCGSAVHTLAAN
jgi:hypothetical protein